MAARVTITSEVIAAMTPFTAMKIMTRFLVMTATTTSMEGQEMTTSKVTQAMTNSTEGLEPIPSMAVLTMMRFMERMAMTSS